MVSIQCYDLFREGRHILVDKASGMNWWTLYHTHIQLNIALNRETSLSPFYLQMFHLGMESAVEIETLLDKRILLDMN